MDQSQAHDFGSVPKPSANFGNIPKHSETFGNIPQDSETFGSVPHDSEAFRTVRNHSEKSEHHTLSVREVARMFEDAGVARTERSIVNWCQPNPQGVARLSAFFDTNERRWFITPQSVGLAIEEERAKQSSPTPPQASGSKAKVEVARTSETFREVPHSSARRSSTETTAELEEANLKLRDLEISSRVKDLQIKLLQDQSDRLAKKTDHYAERLIAAGQMMGQLQSRLMLATATDRSYTDDFNPNGAEFMLSESPATATDSDSVRPEQEDAGDDRENLSEITGRNF